MKSPPSTSSLPRWVNLWPPQSFAEGFIPTSVFGEESSSSGDGLELGQQDEDAERGASSSSTSEISSFVFMGNFVLFVALLTAIFLIHVALASGVEAYWITKVPTPVRLIPVGGEASR